MGAFVRVTVVCLAALAALAAFAPGAFAGRLATGGERAALLRAAASSDKGKSLRLRVGRNGRVTFAPLTLTIRAHVLAVRSQVDPAWALLVVAQEPGFDVRETFVLERVRGRWRVRLAAYRGSEYDALCRRPRPGAAVAIDLGLTEIGARSSCRHDRSHKSLVRPMSAEELASVRAMVEWHEDVDENGDRIRGPVQPEVSEVSTGSCEWDADPETGTPYGEIARADPRWGRVVVMCVTGSDGFAALVNQTLLLVGRAGASRPLHPRGRAHEHELVVDGQPLRHPRRVADTGGAAGRAGVLHPVPVGAARRPALSWSGPPGGPPRARQDSNLRPRAPEARALSTELRAPVTRVSLATAWSSRSSATPTCRAGTGRCPRPAWSGCGPRTRSCTRATSPRSRCSASWSGSGRPCTPSTAMSTTPRCGCGCPAARLVKAEGAQILMTHDGGPAAGRLARLRARFKQADAVVFGHSHLPLHEEAGGFHIFNPGSPTERRRAPRHTMGWARAEAGRLEFRLIEL